MEAVLVGASDIDQSDTRHLASHKLKVESLPSLLQISTKANCQRLADVAGFARSNLSKAKVMAFGVGAYTQGMLRVLRENGADVSTYLTRAYAHYPPSLEGPTFDSAKISNPC